MLCVSWLTLLSNWPIRPKCSDMVTISQLMFSNLSPCPTTTQDSSYFPPHLRCVGEISLKEINRININFIDFNPWELNSIYVLNYWLILLFSLVFMVLHYIILLYFWVTMIMLPFQNSQKPHHLPAHGAKKLINSNYTFSARTFYTKLN